METKSGENQLTAMEVESVEEKEEEEVDPNLWVSATFYSSYCVCVSLHRGVGLQATVSKFCMDLCVCVCVWCA